MDAVIAPTSTPRPGAGNPRDGACDLAVIISDLGPGGAQRVVSALVEAMHVRGVRVCLVTLSAPSGDHFSLPPAIRRVALDLQRPSGSPWAAASANLRRVIALRRAIRALHPATVLAMVGNTNILTIVACVALDVRVVVSERNDPVRQSLGRPWDWLRRLTYRFADVVSANSRQALAGMAAYVPAAKLALVPNPVTLPATPADVSGSRPAPVLLSVGRHARQKAHDVVLEAFSAVAGTHPAWRLAFIGEGEEEPSLRQQAERIGIAARVDWIPPARDMDSVYRGADAFLLPSRFEGTSNALLEAMAYGLPVVVTDRGGALDYVTDGSSGLVVPVDDARALAQAMQSLMVDPGLRQRLGAAARARLADSSLDAVVAAWTKVLALPSLPQ